MNKNNREPGVNGLIYLLFVLLNILALREAYTGNPKWWLFHILTLPLVLIYLYKVHQSNKKGEKQKKAI